MERTYLSRPGEEERRAQSMHIVPTQKIARCPSKEICSYHEGVPALRPLISRLSIEPGRIEDDPIRWDRSEYKRDFALLFDIDLIDIFVSSHLA